MEMTSLRWAVADASHHCSFPCCLAFMEVLQVQVSPCTLIIRTPNSSSVCWRLMQAGLCTCSFDLATAARCLTGTGTIEPPSGQNPVNKQLDQCHLQHMRTSNTSI